MLDPYDETGKKKDPVGIYAVKIITEKNIKDKKKEIKAVGPSKIQFNKSTKEFIIIMDGPLENVFYAEDNKMLEVFVREK